MEVRSYGDGVAERIRTATEGQVNAVIDSYGSGYVDLVIELGIASERIDTIVDNRAVCRDVLALREMFHILTNGI
jgi:hypothetical protein